MCDYSLQTVRSRPARVGDKLTTRDFATGTRGFAAPEDANTAVCVLPGTELAFAKAVSCRPRGVLGWKERTVNHTTASLPFTEHANVNDQHGWTPTAAKPDASADGTMLPSHDSNSVKTASPISRPRDR
jgi:hypothetical protein